MSALGEDFSGGWFRRRFFPSDDSGVWRALAIAVALLVVHQILQLVIATLVLFMVLDGSIENGRDLIKASLISIFPASLVVVVLAWKAAAAGNRNPLDILNLHLPRLTPLGWIVLITGFVVLMYVAIVVIVSVLGLDLSQYTPGPDGASPKTGSAGLVKEAVFDLANEPWLFALVLPSIALGAPIAEELIFRGQLFSALSQTRLGISGTTVVTSALWSILHMSEPWLSVGLIFIMGLVFGWMMYRFGSLRVTIAAHAAWNTFYAVLIFASVGASA
jgi:membrane protease YdiL (CAAX protease family)